MRRQARAAAGLIAAGIAAAPHPAAAVIVEGATIETNGVVTTADRFYFDIAVAGAIEISIVDLTNPVQVARPALKIYRDDGTLDAADLLFSADAAAAGLPAVVNALIPVGSYIALVSEFALPAGSFGPLNPGALNPIGYDYEIGFSDPASNGAQVTCIAEGNLGGGFGLTERVAGGCAGVVGVPEPATLGLLAVALGLLAGVRAGRYASTSSA